MPRRLLACLAVAASFSGRIAPAASAAPPRANSSPAHGRLEAIALARLFSRTCLLQAGHARALRTILAGSSYRHLPDAASARLLARPGQAFGVPNEPGHLMVLSFDDGWCGDGGTGIDPHTLTMQLSNTMRAHGIPMRLMGVGADGDEQRYLLVRPPPAGPEVLLVLLQPSGPSGSVTAVQASLFAAPLPPDSEPPR